MQSYTHLSNKTKVFSDFLLFSMFLVLFIFEVKFFLKKNEERLYTKKIIPKFENQN